jgi:hypothetical protein
VVPNVDRSTERLPGQFVGHPGIALGLDQHSAVQIRDRNPWKKGYRFDEPGLFRRLRIDTGL